MIYFGDERICFAFKLWCRHLKENRLYRRYSFPYMTSFLYSKKKHIVSKIEQTLTDINQLFFTIPITLRDEFYEFYKVELKPIGISSEYIDNRISFEDESFKEVYSDLSLSDTVKGFWNSNKRQSGCNRKNKMPWYVNAMNSNRSRTVRYNNYRR